MKNLPKYMGHKCDFLVQRLFEKLSRVKVDTKVDPWESSGPELLERIKVKVSF